jgi:hypothetical protein
MKSRLHTPEVSSKHRSISSAHLLAKMVSTTAYGLELPSSSRFLPSKDKEAGGCDGLAVDGVGGAKLLLSPVSSFPPTLG